MRIARKVAAAIAQREAAFDVRRQLIQRPHLRVVDDIGLDGPNAGDGRNSGRRIVRRRDRGVGHVEMHSPQAISCG